MIIRPTDIHADTGRAKIGLVTAARDLGVGVDCRLSSMWRVDIDGNERESFLELAREVANAM
jgi:hypothetical protein